MKEMELFQYLIFPPSFKLFVHDIQEPFLYKKYDSMQSKNLLNGFYRYELDKRVSESLSTEDNPCNPTLMGTEHGCFEIQAMNEFTKTMNCNLPWTNEEGNLCNSTSTSEDEMVQALTEYLCTILPFKESCPQRNSTCIDERPCTSIVHNFYKEELTKPILPIAMVKAKVLFKDELVYHVQEYYTYDLQSYIGEVGGIFGLFLGLSFVSIYEMAQLIVDKFRF